MKHTSGSFADCSAQFKKIKLSVRYNAQYYMNIKEKNV